MNFREDVFIFRKLNFRLLKENRSHGQIFLNFNIKNVLIKKYFPLFFNPLLTKKRILSKDIDHSSGEDTWLDEFVIREYSFPGLLERRNGMWGRGTLGSSFWRQENLSGVFTCSASIISGISDRGVGRAPLPSLILELMGSDLLPPGAFL